MSRKCLLVLLSTSLVFPLLAGCLRRETKEITTLAWWITFSPDSDEYPTFQALAEAYTEKTGQAVELVSVPWDDIAPRGSVVTRLALAQESGAGPDLWGPVPHTWTGAFAQGGQALAIQAEQIEDAGQYQDAAMRAGQFDGKQYALPVLMSSIGLIYNKTLVPDPPQTFKELLDLVRDLTDARSERWGLVLPLLSQYHVYLFIDGYGGYIFGRTGDAYDPGDIGLNNEGAVRGIKFLSDLYVKEKLFPESLVDRASMYEDAVRLFAEGRAAMLIDGPWALAEIAASDIDFGIAPFPSLLDGADRPRPLSTVQVLYASAYSSQQDETLDLINYLAGPESIPDLYQALGGAPVRRDVMRQSEFRGDWQAKAWQDQAVTGVLLPNIPELDYVWSPWGQALDQAIPGLTPVQETLDSAVEQIRSYLEEDETP
ncbi:MAG: extracellular solute-binding protein [Anaerolineae bacterium]|nr:extracellular solute-binding protein [Anaerolineae bacterium]